MKNLNMKAWLALCLSTLITALPLSVQAEEAAGSENDDRTIAISVEAEITDVDMENREVTLRTPMGELVTISAGEHVERLHEFAVGDVVVTTYVASLEGELREPTEEEKANPWVELDAAGLADKTMDPGVAVGKVIQAVCTIEGMNRLTRTVTVLDPRGKYHLIADVEPEKMEGVTLGTTLVLTYTEAVAVTLEKKEAAAG